MPRKWGLFLLFGALVYLLATRAGITQLPIFRLSGKMMAVLLLLLLVRRAWGKW
ncbi:MAG: hypothetical protein KJS92_00465 [Bacteroidetes bacterium]|nr:hypothetical protein [Bacteroidota bacterium]